MKRADEAADSVQMVAVQVTDEDAVDSAAPDGTAHELELCPFTAIE
jgi:hypothetical protein